MKVKQVVECKFHHAYTGWNALEFSDADDNSVSIRMTDEDYLSLAETLQAKANRIRKERAELAAEEARAAAAKLEKENEDG
tara:strand:- start:294 stop:536 length:243 start_codon:yes stop_codon:yes gene_type:complete